MARLRVAVPVRFESAQSPQEVRKRTGDGRHRPTDTISVSAVSAQVSSRNRCRPPKSVDDRCRADQNPAYRPTHPPL